MISIIDVAGMFAPGPGMLTHHNNTRTFYGQAVPGAAWICNGGPPRDATLHHTQMIKRETSIFTTSWSESTLFLR